MTRTAALAGARSAAGADQGGLERGLEGRWLVTRGGAFFALSFARGTLLLGLLSGACRPHVSVCDNDCDDALAPAAATGGAAGAHADADAGDDDALGGTKASSADGGAAGAATPECTRDMDCDDGGFCNGSEQCRAGACVRGTEIVCEDGTACVERATEAACTYAQPSPWLLLLTNRQVLGLPTAELGRRPLLTLGQRPSDDLFVGFQAVAFTPDGRHAFFDHLLPDFGQQVMELDFDEGVPKPIELVKNLPNWGVYSTPVFSRDSSRALLFESSWGGYLLDLTGPAAVPTTLSMPFFEGWDLTFCQANDRWVQATSTSTLYSLASGEALATPLDGEIVQVSPDGTRVWVRGENARLVSCADGFEQGPSGLPDARGSWSPDSRWLLASLDNGSGKLFSVSALEATEAWSNAALDHGYWSSDGRALLLRLVGGTEPTFAYLDLTGAAPIEHPLDLPSDASIGTCSARGCFVFAPRLAEDGVDLLWQPFAVDSAPSLLATQLSSESALVWADFERNLLFLVRAGTRRSELMLTDFQASPERAVFDWEGDYSLEASPASDGSGLLLQLPGATTYSNFWLPLPDANSDVDTSVVPLDVSARVNAFQPWSRRP